MPNDTHNDKTNAMSQAYWERWNDGVQAQIDGDIEAHRKADAAVKMDSIPANADVKVEQLSHDFVFGAHIFNFNQLGSDQCNQTYKDLYGTLFNSATIAFYWKKFELEEGKPRFKGEYRDTAEYWNTVTDPKNETHWRRPATDPVVEFCESKGIRLHGHTLTWGNVKWNTPEWLMRKMPYPYGNQIPESWHTNESPTGKMMEAYSAQQIEAMFPEFTRVLNNTMVQRIIDIALYYKGRLDSWDVVNESATDAGRGLMVPGSGICKSHYGPMAGDYTYRSFKTADGVFPKQVKLNINDYNLSDDYVNQIEDLQQRGCKIDIMGAQMHLFDPQICLDIADGKIDRQSPENVWKDMERLSKADLPIHLSEITITAPNNDERGQAIQSIMTRNLYRLWFSIKSMMGITWWNVVDDCGAPGEPSVSGMFTRDMQPKPAYHTLNDLIHNEWKTKLVVKADSEGVVAFRGFRGQYRLTWNDAAGQECSTVVDVK
ncbi:MAG TPA: 1,4-beta-xylanase [Phycisphaerales bacterium]|nr:1,4-beta-xylanase [Phycisphaerales bacterium]HCD33937.1 1,4-beta-xylanase [Phycisphaerales bacterium]|tara:strand:+ start:27470 stop:28930 length:1461 start_codon:yes stop_codon:yes gene_type:complete